MHFTDNVGKDAVNAALTVPNPRLPKTAELRERENRETASVLRKARNEGPSSSGLALVESFEMRQEARPPNGTGQNCLKNLKSFSKKRRRSSIPYFSMAILSIPIPKAKPVTTSGS